MGFGFFDERVNDRRIVSDNGGFPGTNTQIDIYWSQPYDVVVLSNYDGPSAIAVANRIRQLLTRASRDDR